MVLNAKIAEKKLGLITGINSILGLRIEYKFENCLCIHCVRNCFAYIKMRPMYNIESLGFTRCLHGIDFAFVFFLLYMM